MKTKMETNCSLLGENITRNKRRLKRSQYLLEQIREHKFGGDSDRDMEKTLDYLTKQVNNMKNLNTNDKEEAVDKVCKWVSKICDVRVEEYCMQLMQRKYESNDKKFIKIWKDDLFKSEDKLNRQWSERVDRPRRVGRPTKNGIDRFDESIISNRETRRHIDCVEESESDSIEDCSADWFVGDECQVYIQHKGFEMGTITNVNGDSVTVVCYDGKTTKEINLNENADDIMKVRSRRRLCEDDRTFRAALKRIRRQ